VIIITADRRFGNLKIDVRGHAGYAEHGKDIVCAGVSAITQAAILGLQALAEQYPEHVSFTLTTDTTPGRVDQSTT
jgi:uncharacterized protein